VSNVPKKFIGNFKDILTTKDQEVQFYDMFFRILSQLVHQVAATKDIARFRTIANFAGQFISALPLRDSFGIRLLALAVNTGAQYLDYPKRITLTLDGRQDTPILTIC
jgi:hypothetical protein